MVWSPVKEFPIKVWNTYWRGSKKVNFGPNWTKFGPKWPIPFFSPRMANEASFPHVLKPWVIISLNILKFFTKEGQKMSILAKIGPNLALKNQCHLYSIRELNIANFQHGLKSTIMIYHRMFIKIPTQVFRLCKKVALYFTLGE